MNQQNLIGKSLALIITFVEDGKGDSVIVVDGTVEKKDNSYALKYDDDKPPFPIEDGWLNRIETTPPALKGILENSYFFLRLTGGPMPHDLELTGLVPTGLQIEKLKN